MYIYICISELFLGIRENIANSRSIRFNHNFGWLVRMLEPFALQQGRKEGRRKGILARISTKDRNWLLKVRDNFSKRIGKKAPFCIGNLFSRAYPVSQKFFLFFLSFFVSFFIENIKIKINKID